MAEFTFAGIVSSAIVGGLLGLIGATLLPHLGPLALAGALAFSVALLANVLGWLQLPLPQFPRQTGGNWAKFYPLWIAGGLWGFDLGLLFTTWRTFSGAWLPAAVAVLTQDVPTGAILAMAYWIGRASSVWMAPILFRDANSTPEVMDMIGANYPMFYRMHAAGLVWAAMLLTVGLLTAAAP